MRGRRQKDKQTKWRPKLPPEEDLEDNHFDNNSEYDEDCECNSDHVNHHSERFLLLLLLDKSSYEERWEMSCDEYPVQIKRNFREKEGQRSLNRDKTQTAVTNMKLNKRI